MLVLDTHALVFLALAPHRLPAAAAEAIETAALEGRLACSDVSLWEIATLVARGRLIVPVQCEDFLHDLIAAFDVRVLPVTPAVAQAAQAPELQQADPADRLIAATALSQRAGLVSGDALLAAALPDTVLWAH